MLKYGTQKNLPSHTLQRNTYPPRKSSRPHKVTSKSACPLPRLLFVRKQIGRNPVAGICWLWTTHSLLFTQLPANMCVSISHLSLELISGLNHNHMKDDFSKAAAFQNLACASNVACLVWSHCFYWTLSELCKQHVTLPAVPTASGSSANHLTMKKVDRVWLKGTFQEACQPSSAAANSSDAKQLFHGQKQSHSLSPVVKKIPVTKVSRQ